MAMCYLSVGDFSSVIERPLVLRPRYKSNILRLRGIRRDGQVLGVLIAPICSDPRYLPEKQNFATVIARPQGPLP